MLINVSRYFNNNIQLLFLIILAVTLLGMTSLGIMPKAEDPQLDMPINVVEVIAPGATSIEVESKIVNLIEDSLELVDDIKTIETEIKYGSATFIVRSIYGTDPQKSFADLVAAVSRVKDRFPPSVQHILYSKGSPINVNAIKFAIKAPFGDWQTLKLVSKRLKDRIQSSPLVNKAEIWGLPNLIVSVDVDPQKLIQHNISMELVASKLQQLGNPTHAGYIESDLNRYSVLLSGEFKDFDSLGSTVIKSDKQSFVLLKDLANLVLEPYKADNLAFLNNQPVVFVTAQLLKGQSIFEFNQDVLNQVELVKQTYPQVEIETIFDQTHAVEARVSSFLYDLLYGLILILVCLLFFMGPKQSFWVSLALPLTIFITLIVLNAFGYVLQQMTIAGLIVSLGLLVDNSLVIVEQFAKYREKCSSSLETAAKVLSDVGMPLVAGTLTTVLAFLPLMLLKSDTGDFMRALPVSVTVALLASLFVALVILPTLMSVFGVSAHSKYTLSSVLNGFAEKFYKKFLHFCLNWPFIIILLFVGLTGLGISLLPKVGVSLFPKAEKNIIVVNVKTPHTSSIEYTQDVVLNLADELKSFPKVKNVIATVGGSNPKVYYNHIPKRGIANFGEIMLFLDGYDFDHVDTLITQIRDKYTAYAVAEVNVFEFQQGPVTDRPITIRILGDSLSNLAARSTEIEEYLSQNQHVFDIRNVSADEGVAYKLVLDQTRAEKANVSISSAENQIRALLDGAFVGQVNDEYGQTYSIVIKGANIQPDELSGVHIVNQLGESLPISSIGQIIPSKISAPFFHYQRSRMSSVSADVLPGGNVAEITAELEQYLVSLEWSGGLSFQIGGEEEARKENFGGLQQILILVVVSIFIILFLQFNSFAQPAVIISLLPIAFAGGVYGMFVMGVSFSMMAFIGLISLIGIMVNDAIIVVDGFNRGVKESLSPLDAMAASASSRFTPVILTSLTTIMGLLPLTLFGGDLWLPMGTVIITGLVFTTLASLIWVPVLTIKLARKPKSS